jgi:hypothetical protein
MSLYVDQAFMVSKAACKEWNEKNPVGTWVKYHPVIGDSSFQSYQTRSQAIVLSGHTAVVWLDGMAGCVALEACEPLWDAHEPL